MEEQLSPVGKIFKDYETKALPGDISLVWKDGWSMLAVLLLNKANHSTKFVLTLCLYT